MNLADCSYLEWLAVQEVCLFIRDVCDEMILDDVTQMDAVLYESDSFKIMKISNSIILQDNLDVDIRRDTFIFAANADPMDDNRHFSTRWHWNTSRVGIREGNGNILKVDSTNWFWREPRDEDEYLPTLVHVHNEEELQGELFQKSLVYSTEEINVMIMNFMLKDTLGECNTKTYVGLIDKIDRIFAARAELPEMMKKCFPNLNT